eukprot:CAMPEP_0206271508 /NCGR_PEP_ID=MMETSP0047_2-20121206/33472_1 /ASSEMBLY_ACC=CAM_ASM_000192 /TAXON_ID=195065 /ORGANISM="Chroomonas mesostigmatica_cf, Strain CCMP1168" /LENGTH=155 /DNA_ID=CAMNT_0053700287 /DNA_START=104 /DNA_END=571 /DNA_ORIENTATION=-
MLATTARGMSTKAFVFNSSLNGWAANSAKLALRTPMSAANRQARGLSTLKAAQAPNELIQDAISSNKVMVFSKSWCPFCSKAKAALDSVGAKYVVMELDDRDDGAEIQDAMVDLTGGRSVPRVFIGGKFVGGGDETVKLAKSGELAKMVAAAGAA